MGRALRNTGRYSPHQNFQTRLAVEDGNEQTRAEKIQINAYQLNSQRIIQIISDPDFYPRCVAFLYLQDMARARWLQYEKEVIRVRDKHCTGCADQSKNIIEPAIAEFVRQVVKLQKLGSSALEPLREYLTAKLGYRPPEFFVYYKESGRAKKLTF